MSNEVTGVTEETASAAVTTDAEAAAPQPSQTGEIDPAAGDRAVKEIEGLKQAALAEAIEARRIRQALEREYEELKKAKNSTEEDEIPPDDDFVTGKHLKTIVKKIEKQEIESKQEAFRREQAALLQSMQRDHPDYKEVIALAEDLIQNDPAYAGMDKVILSSVEGARIAYNLGKLHPKYIEKLSKQEREKTAKTIQKNIDKPHTLTGVQGSASPTLDAVKYWSNMSKKDFEAIEAELMGLT